MRIAIADANIFIDLIELNLINCLFEIDLEVHTTMSVLNELHDYQQDELKPFLENEQLIVRFLDDEQMKAIELMEVNKGFSETDKTLLFFCQIETALMLTGEGLMRRFCQKNGLEVRGIIWLFDSFLAKDLIGHALAIEKMKKLLLINNRLPITECNKAFSQTFC